MLFEVELNGRSHQVSIDPLPGDRHRYRVTIDGTARTIDVSRLDHRSLSLILTDAGHASHAIDIVDPGGLAPLSVRLGHEAYEARINGSRARRRSKSEPAGHVGELRISSPMPGRVVRVLVAPGEDVAVRQGLVVVEAMKMENELASPKAGRVQSVNVREGEAVEAGRLLLVVE